MVSVVGAGLPRSATNSLHTALEILGYPTLHMKSILETLGGAKDPKLLEMWYAHVVEHKPADWAQILAGYDACVDNPACMEWEAILAANPDAKVILTVRDAAGWARSYTTLDTFKSNRLEYVFGALSALGLQRFEKALVLGAFLKLNTIYHFDKDKKASAVPRRFSDVPLPSLQELEKFYSQWTDDVKARCPASQLLVFDVRDGWEPLCTFLNKPVPSTPFPNSNAGRNGLNWVMGGAILRSFKTPSTLSALALVGVAVGLCYSWSKRV